MAGSRGERLRKPPAVARVLERVTATARRHEMFLPGECVLVSVSGGPDSMCLLHSLVRLRRLFRIRLEVFHFDHRMRRDSAKDGAYVERAAAKLRVPFHLETAESPRDPEMSPEQWAREVRRAATGRVLIVAYTVRRRDDGERIRIISARRSSRKERAAYAAAARD